MMREKVLKLVITFHTTEEAIALETVCRREAVPGRLIPVPRQISSGCGLAWSMPVEWDGDMGEFMDCHGLSHEACGTYLL